MSIAPTQRRSPPESRQFLRQPPIQAPENRGGKFRCCRSCRPLIWHLAGSVGNFAVNSRLQETRIVARHVVYMRARKDPAKFGCFIPAHDGLSDSLADHRGWGGGSLVTSFSSSF